MENNEMKMGFKDGMRKCMVMALALCLVLGSAVAVSAAETVPITANDWQPVMDSLTAQISVPTVIAVLAVIVAACVGLVFMWWGVRLAIRALMSAFRRGKITV